MRVAQLRVLEEVRPRPFQLIAQEVEIIPGFFLLVLLVFGDDHAGRAAQPARHARKRQHAAHERRQQHDQNRQIDQRIQRKDAPYDRENVHQHVPPDRALPCIIHDGIVTDLTRSVKRRQNFTTSTGRIFLRNKRYSLKRSPFLSPFHEIQNNCENIRICPCSF